MNRRIRYYRIASLIITLSLFLGIGTIFYFSKIHGVIPTNGFNITFTNNTDNKIEGLRITYQNIENDIELMKIESNTSYNININPTEKFGENHMKLYYYDKNGFKHEEFLIGYFENGYKGDVNVVINEINESGIMTFDIDNNVSP